jgi:hypothetical protein
MPRNDLRRDISSEPTSLAARDPDHLVAVDDLDARTLVGAPRAISCSSRRCQPSRSVQATPRSASAGIASGDGSSGSTTSLVVDQVADRLHRVRLRVTDEPHGPRLIQPVA